MSSSRMRMAAAPQTMRVKQRGQVGTLFLGLYKYFTYFSKIEKSSSPSGTKCGSLISERNPVPTRLNPVEIMKKTFAALLTIGTIASAAAGPVGPGDRPGTTYVQAPPLLPPAAPNIVA